MIFDDMMRGLEHQLFYAPYEETGGAPFVDAGGNEEQPRPGWGGFSSGSSAG